MTSLFFNVNGAARDTDNNKLHNEKTQLTKDQRYYRLKRKRTFQTSRKEQIPWVEASGRLITLSNLIEIKLPKTFSALYLWKSNLNDITGDHANENYEVNMWSKYCKISRMCNKKALQKNSALLKGTTNMEKLTV